MEQEGYVFEKEYTVDSLVDVEDDIIDFINKIDFDPNLGSVVVRVEYILEG